MKKTLLSVFAFCGILTTTNAQTFEWASQIKGTATVQGLSVSSIGSDIYSTGTFSGVTDFDPGVGIYNLTPQGGYDVYIQKLDQNGGFLWAKSLGGSGTDMGRIINDYGTHIIISGTFSGTVDFDPGAGTASKTSNGSIDLFILALDDNGDFLWVKTIGGAAAESIGGQELDLSNDIVITGGFTDSMTVDVGVSPLTVYAVNSKDVFVLKMNLTTGNINWIKTFGGTSTDAGTSLAIKSNKNILIAGGFRNIMDANPDTSSTSNFTLSSTVGTSVFLVELDELGVFVNAFSFDNSDNMEVYDMELDNNENIYLTGPFKATTDFNPKSGITNISSNGDQDCYVVKLTPQKDLIWAKTFGGIGLEQSFGIEVGANGDVYTAGRYSSTVDFDPGAGTTNQTAVGNSQDIFIHKLDSSGNFQLVHTFGTSGLDIARGLELDIDGNIYINGLFATGTIDFDPTVGTTSFTALGASDAFLMKFSTVTPAGIYNIQQKQEVKLYPNPVQNQLFIELEKEQITGINIIDVSGKMIKSIRNNNTKSIDVSSLKQGVYTLVVNTKSGVFNARFVKQ